MNKDIYISMNKQIKPNAKLLSETINMMNEEVNSQNQLARFKKRRYITTVASCFIVIISVSTIPLLRGIGDGGYASANDTAGITENGIAESIPQNVEIDESFADAGTIYNQKIETELKDGEHTQTVKLSNGELNFNIGDFNYAQKRVNLDFAGAHKKEWTIEQVNEYLGRDFRPTELPTGLKDFSNSGKWQVAVNSDGSMAYDSFTVGYRENDSDEYQPLERKLTIDASKGKIPFQCGIYKTDLTKKSNINGVELFVGYRKESYGPYDDNHTPTGYYDMYVAEFIYKDIGYYILSDNLTQEEFINILFSIIK